MPVVTPPPPNDTGPRVISLTPPQVPRVVLLIGLLLALIVLGIFYWWFVQRIEVPANNVLVLTHRVGRALPDKLPNGEALPPEFDGQVLLYPELLKALGEEANSTRYKGIMFEVLGEGRYFYDPFLWKREIRAVEFVAQEETGVLVRKYGKPLEAGKVVATKDNERGPLADKLAPGRYPMNPYAYDVYRVPRIEIPAGHVGIQTLRHGDPPTDANAWVVQPGERGVQPEVLSPGREYNNPYVRRIDIIDVRSHTLDLRGDGAIRFPSKDSFEIKLEATVEYAISQDKAPYVMVAIGDHSDIEEKLILPYARSLARIEGSKLVAREFISGESRESFQDSVFNGLRTLCGEQGIEIRSTLIRRIEPPAAIANPISERQVAAQQIKQFHNEMDLAQARARLVEQEELQKQNQEIGEANRGVVTVIKQSEQAKAVALTEANKRLEVAKLKLKAAEEEAAAIVSLGRAEADVILLNYKAEAEPLFDAVNAFGNGETYAQFFFYQKLGPAVKSVLASTDGPFSEVFRALSNAPVGQPGARRPATEGGSQ